MVLENKHLNKNIFETFGLDPNDARTFYYDERDQSSFDANEIVDLKEGATSPTWNGRVSAFRMHHVCDVQYPSLNLLTDPAEEFLLNKPRNSEQRYAPQPLIIDDEITRMASRDRPHDNGFYSVYRCNQAAPDLSLRTITGKDLFADVEEAVQCHGFTHIGAVVFVNRSQAWLGPQIRIRRSTRFLWNQTVDYNEHDYTLPLKEFLESRVQPAWYSDLIHLLGIESDRAARFIALKLKHFTQTDTPRKDLADVYVKFLQSFGAESRQDQDLISAVRLLVKPFKPTVLKRTTKCIGCGQRCVAGACLPCSSQHVMHDDCLLHMCRTADVATVGCPGCRIPIFASHPDMVDWLKFHVRDRVYHNDPRYNTWENFEKSCADLDIKQAATNTFHITITRDFMSSLFHKIVQSSIEPGTPHHLRFDTPEEYALLESLITDQFTHLEGVRTTIWALDRWLKRRVFSYFRHAFLANKLDNALTDSEKRMLHQHDFMRKILRRGWYDAHLRNLNRTLQFLSQRACLCEHGENVVWHWHGGREFYNPRVVERNQREVTPARREAYAWQGSEVGRAMMRKFEEETRKGKEELFGGGGRKKKKRVPLWTADE